MSEADDGRSDFAAGCALLTAGVVYLVTTAGRVGIVYYLPERHRWTLTPPTGVIAMDWFSRAAVTMLAAGLALAVGTRLAPADPSRRRAAARTLAALGGTALAWSLAYTVLTLLKAS